MTEPDLTVDPASLDTQLPPEQARMLHRADAHLADALDAFAHDPEAFDAAWAAAEAAHAVPRPVRWPVVVSALTGLAVAASLALAVLPTSLPGQDPAGDPVEDDAAAAPDDGCRPDGLELTAHKGALTRRDLACMDRLVANGSLREDHADRLRLVDLWNRGDIEAWQELAVDVALAGDGDPDLAYKLIVQQGVLDDPEVALALARVVLDHGDAWPGDVRGGRLETATTVRREAVRRLAEEEAPRATPADTGPAEPSTPAPSPPVDRHGGHVEVVMGPTSQVTHLDVKCELSPERWRASFQDGVAHVDHVPLREEDKCYGILKGPMAPAKISVAGGMSYACSVDGVVARCKETPLHRD